MKLMVSTRNKHKLEEISTIFNVQSIDLVDVNFIENPPEVEEDGTTFQANAVKKAVTLAMASGLWTIADDSGLEVDALQGQPGVYSARYAGEHGDYLANNNKLLEKMAGQSERTARFRCAVALSSPAGRAQFVEGTCEGIIVESARGDKGFGYDPLFIPDGHDITFAEMESEQKNSISHRAAALNAAREKWFSEEPYCF